METDKENKKGKEHQDVVFCDFDGTLTKRTGEAIQRQYKNRYSYILEESLLKGAELGEITLLPGADAALESMIENGYKVIINSNNYASVVTAVLKAALGDYLLGKLIIRGFNSATTDINVNYKKQTLRELHSKSGKNCIFDDDPEYTAYALRKLPRCIAYGNKPGHYNWKAFNKRFLEGTKDAPQPCFFESPAEKKLDRPGKLFTSMTEEGGKPKKSSSETNRKLTFSFSPPRQRIVLPEIDKDEEDEEGIDDNEVFTGSRPGFKDENKNTS